MKFNRTDLIARAEAEIQRRKDEFTEVQANNAKEAEGKRAEWLATKGPDFVLFANRIKDKIRKGRPIVGDDIPRDINESYGRLALFHDQRLSGGAPNVSGLQRLVDVLSAVSDDEVTSAGLAALGFRDFRQLFG